MSKNKNRIILKNVRLSYPSIFKHALYNGESTGKYGATLLLPKEDVKTKKTLDREIKKAKIEGLKK